MTCTCIASSTVQVSSQAKDNLISAKSTSGFFFTEENSNTSISKGNSDSIIVV